MYLQCLNQEGPSGALKLTKSVCCLFEQYSCALVRQSLGVESTELPVHTSWCGFLGQGMTWLIFEPDSLAHHQAQHYKYIEKGT